MTREQVLAVIAAARAAHELVGDAGHVNFAVHAVSAEAIQFAIEAGGQYQEHVGPSGRFAVVTVERQPCVLMVKFFRVLEEQETEVESLKERNVALVDEVAELRLLLESHGIEIPGEESDQ